jgi:hypothetical protein
VLYRLVLGRQPEEAEIRIALDFIAAVEKSQQSQLGTWQQYAQVLLLTNEMMFLD